MSVARVLIGFSLGVLCLVGGCAPAERARDESGRANDGAYDSEFPLQPTSPRLTEIAESVRMVNAIASYRTYLFPMSAKIRVSNLRMPYLLDGAERMLFQNRRASGSGLLIHVHGRRLALVSCAHIVDFADTILTYHMGPDRQMTDIIRTISIKEAQEIYVAGIPGARRMEILSTDRDLDLVLIGKQFDDLLPPTISAVRYPLGRSKELGWGTFVYIFGYPAGFRMITHAIVSNPNRDQGGAFLLNAGFKPGYSGGAIVALRDGIPNFEIVGLLKASKGSIEYTVSPTREGERFEGDLSLPYTGDLYVERRSDLDHGVAEAVSAESIREFLLARQAELKASGYEIGWGMFP